MDIRIIWLLLKPDIRQLLVRLLVLQHPLQTLGPGNRALEFMLSYMIGMDRIPDNPAIAEAGYPATPRLFLNLQHQLRTLSLGQRALKFMLSNI